MKRVPVSLGERSYDVVIGHGILGELGDAVRELGLGPREMIVTGKRLWPLYGKPVQDSLASTGFDVCVAQMDDDEEAKSVETVISLYDKLVENEFDRNSGMVAVGGGVVGDVAGFTAATFMRGIRFVQVPTTLLAQVDSSIGGKTGVNLSGGKNLVGAFYQPTIVWTDISTLKTLPERELRSGLAEIIKYAVVADPALFGTLESKMRSFSEVSADTLIDIVSRCCTIKARIVEQDERDYGVRSILNYGHTAGHALETLTNYTQYTHGEAVGLGMIVAARISREIGATDQTTVDKQERLISAAGLPTRIDRLTDPQIIVRQLTRDKKRLAGHTRWVLLKTIGEVFLTN
ncbi:MAG TPA: 3-dehydroquinate synthase, partial [Candidatus Acidoferrum sp.]|nr:3-dehydroquinate synthase [Candidatus Acidoferrum sp.]